MSLIALALSSIVRQRDLPVAQRPDATRKIWVFDYEEQFEILWNFEGPASSAAVDLVILVESGRLGNAGEVEYTRHLSASDWAIICCRQRAVRGVALPNILILDARNYDAGRIDYGNDLLDTLQRKRSIPLPIRVFGPSSPNQLNELLDRIHEVLDSGIAGGKLSAAHCAAIGSLWLQQLSDSDDRNEHHFLNNALAPLAIAAQQPRDSIAYARVASFHARSRPARHALMEALRLVAGDGRAVGKDDVAVVPELHDASFVLVDDQAEYGWSALLSQRLMAAGITKGLQTFTSVEGVLARLNEMVPDATRGGPRPFRFELGLFGGENEVLLLDIRLFGGTSPNSAQKEMDYFRTLVGQKDKPGLIERLNSCGPKELADKGLVIAKEEVFAIRSWLDVLATERAPDWRSETQYLQAITLLARLLACLDCSYPIILFSSTGQRRVAQIFAAYPSIYVEFPKPRFGPYAPSEIAADFWNQFDSSLAFARKRAILRKGVRKMLERSRAATTATTRTTTTSYVEIFTDESGNDSRDHFVVTALAVVYNEVASAPEAESFNRKLPDRRVAIQTPEMPDERISVKFQWEDGGRYADNQAMPKRMRNRNDDSQWAVFRTNTSKLLVAAADWKEVERLVAVSIFVTKDDQAREQADGLGDFGLDALNFKLLLSSLEILVAEVLGAGVTKPDYPLSIFLANRRRTLANSDGDGSILFEKGATEPRRLGFFSRFRINPSSVPDEEHPGKLNLVYQSIADETPVRLWTELCSRSLPASNLKPDICRGEPMNAKPGASRELHNLADCVASSLNSSRGSERRLPLRSDHFQWYADLSSDLSRLDLTYTHAGDALDFAIDSCRYHDAGDNAGSALLATLAVLAETDEDGKQKVPSVLPLLVRKGAAAVRQLDARQYETLTIDYARWGEGVSAVARRSVVLPVVAKDPSPAQEPDTVALHSFESTAEPDGSYRAFVNDTCLSKKKPTYVAISVGGSTYFADVLTQERADRMREQRTQIRVRLTKDNLGPGFRANWLD